jgi:hypothetical protein
MRSIIPILKTHQLDRELWAEDPGQQLLDWTTLQSMKTWVSKMRTTWSMDFFFLDKEPTSEEDSDSDGFDTDEEVDEDELEGLENEADIAHFNAVLTHAQAMAIKAECEAAGEKPKRKWHYMGNSVHTKWHHAQKRRELAATSQTLISSMFTKKVTELTPMEEQEAPPDAIEIVDDPDSSGEGDNEIETPLKQLFPVPGLSALMIKV